LVGRSLAFRAALAAADRYAQHAMTDPAPEPVLIRGDTGVGKELLAQRMHRQSGRAGAFVPVSGGELVEGVFPTQLFGHVDGAYTGAGRGSPGAFEQADRGTLFLDELQEWPLGPQHALLRAVAERSVQRLRGQRRILATCAMLFASSVPLDELVTGGRLAKDLRHRIGYLEVVLPPLTSRKVDILVLADHFRRRWASQRNNPVAEWFDPLATERLLTYRWPGNAREVERVVAYACVNGVDSGRLGLAHLPPVIQQAPEEPVDACTRAEVAEWALEREGQRRRAAALLGIHPNTLDYRRGEASQKASVTKARPRESTT
jgi:DNA-binding NtrC family response regulator